MDSSKLNLTPFSSSALKHEKITFPYIQRIICQSGVKRAISASLLYLSHGLCCVWKGKRILLAGKSGKTQTPAELVRATRKLLLAIARYPMLPKSKKWARKLKKLAKHITKMNLILYGSNDRDPVAMDCTQLTQEVFRDDTMTLLCMCLPKLDLETRKDVTRVVVNLQHQPVQCHLIAGDYLEAHKELLDFLVCGYECMDNALHYSRILRECIRHRGVAKYILESDKLTNFFSYIDLPNFGIASDAAATFKELLTRHKLMASEFLATNYSWFFKEFNGKLLQSPNYITRRMAVQLLGDILLDRLNAPVRMRYTSSKHNLQIIMDLLIEQSRSIQIAAFHVFKTFVKEDKPPEIVRILVLNRSKLLKLFENLTPGKEDEEFDQDKAHIVKEIVGLC